MDHPPARDKHQDSVGFMPVPVRTTRVMLKEVCLFTAARIMQRACPNLKHQKRTVLVEDVGFYCPNF